MEHTYDANALGLGGVIERGRQKTIIPSIGSVVLAPTGGEGSSEIHNYQSEDVSFSTLYTRVGGLKAGPGMYLTYSDILITNLEVMQRLKVGFMYLSLRSTRFADDPMRPEPEFQMQATYRGVMVDDEEVVPELDIDVCDCSTYESFVGKARSNRRMLSVEEAPELASETDFVAALERRPEHAVLRGSLIRELKPAHGLEHKLERDRNKLKVPGLGKVYFGELLLKRGRRRVNLLRFDFGPTRPQPFDDQPADKRLALEVMAADGTSTPTGGALVMASGEGNGSPVWPRQ